MVGVWKGTYIEVTPQVFSSKMTLKFFIRRKRSGFVVKSYTPTHDSNNKPATLVCHVIYKKLSTDSIYLAEEYVIGHEDFPGTSCRQEMFLKLSTEKGKLILSGIWKTYIDNCKSKGTIKFIKQ